MSLGKRIATFHTSPIIRAALIAAMMATAFIVFLAAREIPFLAVFISMGWLVFVGYFVYHNLWRGTQIEVFEHGMIVNGEPWKWALFSAILRVDENNTLILFQGSTPVFSLPLVENRDQLFALIVESVEPIIYQRMMSRLEQGHSVHYRNLSILPDGLEIRNRVVKWEDIHDINATAHAIILDVGEPIIITTRHMHNAHVVERIIREHL